MGNSVTRRTETAASVLKVQDSDRATPPAAAGLMLTESTEWPLKPVAVALRRRHVVVPNPPAAAAGVPAPPPAAPEFEWETAAEWIGLPQSQ